jgi:hypothetical protein
METLVGIGELGCPELLPSPPGAGHVPTSTADGIVWLPAGTGGPMTVDVAVAGGALAVTVNGVSSTISGVLVQDAFGVALGYLLPV